MGVLAFLIQMASLMCRILRLGSLSTSFTPSQSMMWFSVVAWSVRADLLMVNIILFFRSLCISLLSYYLHPFFVPPVTRVLIVFLFPQCTQYHSYCLVFGTPVRPVLLALLCPWDVPTGTWGGVGTHSCCYSIFLQYSVYSL